MPHEAVINWHFKDYSAFMIWVKQPKHIQKSDKALMQ